MKSNKTTRLKLARMALSDHLGRRINQDEFAKAMDITRPTETKMEIGVAAIPKHRVMMLCREYPINPDYINGKTDAPILLVGENRKTIAVGDLPISSYNDPRHKENDIYSSNINSPVLFFDRFLPFSGQDVTSYLRDMENKATERFDIPWWNGYAQFSTTILDEALEDPYSYGNIVVASIEQTKSGYPDFDLINYGDVHVVHAKGKEFVRIIEPHEADDKKLILRADDKKRDRYQDISVLKDDITLIALAVGAMKVKQKKQQHYQAQRP